MKQWLPVPIGIIETVDNERRLSKAPASTLDGFAFAYLKAQRGAPLTQRQLASWAGWSKRKATEVLNAVQEAKNAWADQKRTKNGPAVRTKNGPPKPNDTNNLQQSLDQERTRNGPDPIQKCTDRARAYSLQLDPQLHNYNYVGITSDHTPPEPEQKKPKKTRKRGQNIGTEATRALWSQLNERRKQRKKGSRALKLTPEINRALREALTYATAAEVLHAYEWFTTASGARWWQDHDCDLSTFCRKKHLGQFINNAAEWTPETDHQTNRAPDILDLDASQFDENGNVIHLNNRGNNGN